MKNGNKKAFTLIELLVVVLIISILSAIALPQYQLAVEKARISEAVAVLRAIANANQAFYLLNGRYAAPNELNLLDVTIPGEITTGTYSGRVQASNFIYSPGGLGIYALALAQRIPMTTRYYIYIPRDTNRIYCVPYSEATSIMRKLCTKLNAKGSL